MGARIGELLVQEGIATRELVEQAAAEARRRASPLCSRLLELGIPEEALAGALAAQRGVPGAILSRSVIPLELLDLVPRPVAEGDLILPVSAAGGRLHLAMARPDDARILAEVRFVTGREVSGYVAVTAAIRSAIVAAYAARDRGETVLRGDFAAATEPHLEAVHPGGDPAEIEEVEAECVDSAPVAAEPGAGAEIEIAVGGGEDGEVVATVRADARRCVLVVDDEPEIRQLLQRTLEAKGFAVETAADGAEAVERADALVPDLVLLDAMLPRVHGFEACRRIRAGARTRGVPVVMMTAVYRGWRFAQDARDAFGAEDYVEKPFQLDDLLRRIGAVLESRTGRSSASARSAEPHLSRGKALLAAGRLEDAIAALHAAVQADPYAAEAHDQLGRAHQARRDPFSAMTAYERALDIRPSHLPTLRTLAGVYQATGFRRKAAEALERALGAAPNDAVRDALKQDLIGLLG